MTPQGCPPVEGPTPTKAWQALYASDEAGKARSLTLSGKASSLQGEHHETGVRLASCRSKYGRSAT